MKRISKKNPKFSVITVVKNDKFGIVKTIKSVINQSYKDFEYLIIDGDSKDGTLKLISKYKNKIDYIISKPDKGLYFAMNKGLKVAKGKIIVFVNSGDFLTKDALNIINNIFDKNKKINFVFGTVKRHYTKNTILKYGFNLDRLKYNFDFATSHSSGFFLKKNIYKKIGLFNTKYKCSADYDVYLKALMNLKIKGGSTKKGELIGIVKSGGFSSKYGFLNHIFEEARIRINNKQSFLLVSAIFFNAIIKKIISEIF